MSERMSAATWRQRYVDIPQKKGNKFNAVKSEGPTSDGSFRTYDSKWEAKVASMLMYEQMAGEILSFDTQFKIEWTPHTKHGVAIPQLTTRHRVDFRAHLPDGSYRLVEAKGVVTAENKKLLKIINAWLTENLDHTYLMLFEKSSKRPSRKIQSRGFSKRKPSRFNNNA